MEKIACCPDMDADIVKFLRGLDETQYAAICLYAAQRIENLEGEAALAERTIADLRDRINRLEAKAKDLKSEVRIGAHLFAVRQDRINDLEHILAVASRTLSHIKADNDSNSADAMITGNMKILLDESVSAIESFFGGEEEEHGGEKPERAA